MNLILSDDLKLPLEAVTRTFSILAMKGVGKTHCGVVMTEEMLKAGQNVIVIDPIGVWWGLRSSKDGRSEGHSVVIFGGEHGDAPLEETAGETIASAIVQNNFSAILDLSQMRKGAQVRLMTAFAESLYRLNRRPLHLMVDEADAFAPQRPMKGEERLLGSFEDIVRRGRARGLGVTLITQRAAIINKNVLTQTEVLVCLRVMAPQDREAVEAWIEAHGTEKEKESFTNSLASLKRGQAWFWSPGWLDLFKLVQIRDRETFDSSATPKVGQVASKPRKLSRVDIARLGQQIQATVEKAKENDPAELRRQIAALKKEVAQKPIAKPAAPKIEKVLIFHERDRRLIHKALDAFNRTENAVSATLKGLRSIHEGLEKLLAKSVQSSAPITSVKKPWLPPPARRDPSPRTGVVHGDQENGVPPPGELKILRAVAQHAEGTSRDQLTVLTGYRKSSRDTYVSKLFGKGLIALGPDGQLHATTEGLKVLGPGFEPLPTGEALREYWLNHLPPGEKKIFECILGDYPNPISRELISEQTGYLKSSRDTYLSKLASRKLIEAKMAGMVVASPKLFE